MQRSPTSHCMYVGTSRVCRTLVEKVTGRARRASAKPRSRSRALLHERLRLLIEKWEPIVGVRVRGWRIKEHEALKDYWASVDVDHATIAFCARLAGRSSDFLEFVVVHELVHLLTRGTRGHGQRFYNLMDVYLPSWRRHAMAET